MQQIDLTYPIIIGLGKTGFSCAKYFSSRNIDFCIIDNRPNPPLLKEFLKDFPNIKHHFGSFDTNFIKKATTLILSPGVSFQEPIVQKALKLNIPIIGDIELFATATSKPIVAITGSNGKSTVTTLVGEMAKNANVKTQIGGNLGTPALDLLNKKDTELYVIELSSFQLETTFSLKPTVSTVLNISPDHIDRHGNLENYIKAKQRIFSNCQNAVINRNCSISYDKDLLPKKTISFGLDIPKENHFGITNDYLTFGSNKLLHIKEVKIQGSHQIANSLAALALGKAINLPLQAMIETLKIFSGLPHRCQLVAKINNIYWYNDSKGTNVGATKAAIEGIATITKGKIILIAGGIGKNADFSSLQEPIQKYVKSIILIGRDAKILEKAFQGCSKILHAKNMKHAVELSYKEAKPNDAVLLSPACASFDMFDNFEHRGKIFANAVLSIKK